MSRRSGWSVLAWSLAVLTAFLGCYIGLFVTTFAWWYQDIDGPVSISGRVGWSVLGLVVLAPSLVLVRWCYRRRPWAVLAGSADSS